MSADAGFGLVSGFALAAAGAAAARIAFRGGALSRERSCALLCPRDGRAVDCRMVQDIRIGQWRKVQSCSAFAEPERIQCGEECRGLMNLGLLMPQTGAARLAG